MPLHKLPPILLASRSSKNVAETAPTWPTGHRPGQRGAGRLGYSRYDSRKGNRGAVLRTGRAGRDGLRVGEASVSGRARYADDTGGSSAGSAHLFYGPPSGRYDVPAGDGLDDVLITAASWGNSYLFIFSPADL